MSDGLLLLSLVRARQYKQRDGDTLVYMITRALLASNSAPMVVIQVIATAQSLILTSDEFEQHFTAVVAL